MIFHWSLSVIKSTQVSITLLRILAVGNNAVLWIVSTLPLISLSSRHFNNPLVTVPKASITISTIVTFMFHIIIIIIIIIIIMKPVTEVKRTASLLSSPGSSPYSGRSQRRCRFDGLYLSSGFKVSQLSSKKSLGTAPSLLLLSLSWTACFLVSGNVQFLVYLLACF